MTDTDDIPSKLKKIKAGDVVIYRATKPDFVQRGIMYTCNSVTHHVEVVGKIDDHLRVGNATVPCYQLDFFDERVRRVEAGDLKMIVMRWHTFCDDPMSASDLYTEFQDHTNLALQLWEEVPPKYDTLSIAVIFGNIVKREGRKYLNPWFAKWMKDSLRNNEHRLYCAELAEVICKMCGHFKMLEGLPPQTHSAPVHLERQLRAGKFKVIADFGDLSSLVFSPAQIFAQTTPSYA